jgi:alpha-tubulin suppressor-like RCC1 family protein
LSRIAAGADHSCAVAIDGLLWCWGANATGQLGNSGSVDVALPLRVAGTSWTNVAAGYGETCALQSSSDLWCWGNNGSGQLGNGSSKSGSSVAIPLQVSGAEWSNVSVGEYHVVGLQQDGTLWTWGDNSSDQLGDQNAPSTGRASPGQVGTSQWLAVSAGSLHGCAIQSDRTLWCWGNNADGQLGDGTTIMRLDPTQVIGTDWASVSAGLYHTCATKIDGSLWCWGDNSNGQLGFETTTNSSVSPAQITVGTATWVAVTAGQSHTCGLQSDKSLWCWGSNTDGQLGIGSNLPSNVPAAVAQGSTWAMVSAGGAHTCAIDGNGALWCWGKNANGQLGISGTISRTSPVRLGQ